MKHKLIKLISSLVIGYSLLVLPAHAATSAATMTIVSDKATASLDEPVHMNLVLGLQGDNANAVQATVLFPSDRFALGAVSDANSIVSFWIAQPRETSPGEISFSGIMPGGFQRASGTILSFVLIPRQSGSASVRVASATVLRNDGEGTAIPVATSGKTIVIGSSEYTGPGAGGTANGVANADDTTPPEPFTPLIGRDIGTFGGKYFIAFSTTDKESGIDHYEILEMPAGAALGKDPAWQSAESPYLLRDQSLGSDVYVRAIDYAGNATVAKVPASFPSHRLGTVQIFLLIGGILMVLLIVWIMRKRRARRRS